MKFTKEIIDIVKCEIESIENQKIKRIVNLDDEIKIYFENKMLIVNFIFKTKLNVRSSRENYILHI